MSIPTDELENVLKAVLRDLSKRHKANLNAIHIGNAMRMERNRYMHPSYSQKRAAYFRKTLEPIFDKCGFTDDDKYTIWSIIFKGTYS